MASCPRLHSTTALQAGRSTMRQRPYAGGTVLLCDNENWNRMRHRSGNDLPQAGHSTRRHDGAAVIPDFRPRLANRCSQEVKSGAIRASILDFKPRLANRCSQEVKTMAIPPAQGLEHCAAPAGRLGLGNTTLPGNAAVGVVGVLLVEL